MKADPCSKTCPTQEDAHSTTKSRWHRYVCMDLIQRHFLIFSREEFGIFLTKLTPIICGTQKKIREVNQLYYLIFYFYKLLQLSFLRCCISANMHKEVKSKLI